MCVISHEKFDYGVLRRSFASSQSSPSNLLVINDFFEPTHMESVYCMLEKAFFERWVVYKNTEALVAKFSEKIYDYDYITIHRKTREKIHIIEELYSEMSTNSAMSVLSSLTGIEIHGLKRSGSFICHAMGPGDFLSEHTDYGDEEPHTKLVVSLSLTKSWAKHYGGETHFLWDKGLTVFPKFNQIVLFKPHSGSTHMVAQLKKTAAVRYNLTFHYI